MLLPYDLLRAAAARKVAPLALAAGLAMIWAATPAGALSAAPTAQEQRLMERAAQFALENNRVGQSEGWRNPATGHVGAVTPLRNYRLGANQPCRDYEMTLTAAGRTDTARYSACRQSDGNWVNRDTVSLAGTQFTGGTIISAPPAVTWGPALALTDHDQRLMERAAQTALETHAVGRSAAWSNPESGRSGAVTPLRDFRAGLDRPCRDYEMTVASAGATETARHTACRQPTGMWVNREDGTLAGSRFVVSAPPVALGPAPADIPPVPLSKRDKELMERTAQEALETYQTGQTANWSNSETGHLGGVTPTRTYQQTGRTCRDYRMTVTTNGPTWVDNSTACRLLDGSWMDSRHAGPAGAFFEGQAYGRAELAEPPYYGSPPGLPRGPAVWDFPDER